MKYIEMAQNGAARMPISLASLDGKFMAESAFLIDTGATRTTIHSRVLQELGYNKDWLAQNKIALKENEMPVLADGRKLNAYGIPAMRLAISGHEILHDGYFLTSDEAPKLGFLLGADILSYFDIFFKYSEWRVYFEFRKDRLSQPSKPGDSFAYTAIAKGN